MVGGNHRRFFRTRAGRECQVSHEQAEEHAHAQCEQYNIQRRSFADASDSDFDQAVKRITDTEADKSKPPRRRTRKRQENEPEKGDRSIFCAAHYGPFGQIWTCPLFMCH
jgi:hypothetical protein